MRRWLNFIRASVAYIELLRSINEKQKAGIARPSNRGWAAVFSTSQLTWCTRTKLGRNAVDSTLTTSLA